MTVLLSPRMPQSIAQSVTAVALLSCISGAALAEGCMEPSAGLLYVPISARAFERADADAFTFNEEMLFGRHLGFTATASSLNEHLDFSFRNIENRDLLKGRRVVSERHLERNCNWQREAGLSFTTTGLEGVSFAMSGGFYDARRPAAVRNPRLQLGFPTRWSEHSAADFLLNLGLFDDRLRYEGGYARSRYRGSFDYQDIDRRPDRWRLPPSGGRGSAQLHRLEADLLSGEEVDLSVFGHYESASLAFRAAPRSGAKLRFRGGEVREFGASLSADQVRMSLTHLERRARGRAQEKLEAEIGYGATTITLFHDIFSRGNGRVWRTREDSFGGALAFDVDTLRGGDDDTGLKFLFPSSVRLGTQRGLVRYVRSPDEPPDVKKAASATLSWAQDGGFTNVSFYRSITESPEESSAGADETDFGVDLSQSFYGDNWDFTWYASVGGFDSNAFGGLSRDRWIFGGVSLGYDPEHLPTMSMAVDFDRFQGDYPDFGERFSEQSVSLDLGLDFSKYLHEGNSMSVHYHVLRTENSSSNLSRTEDLQNAISLRIGMRF